MSRFGGLKCITVGGEVVLVGFCVNGEVSFLVKSFKLTAGLFHGAKLRGVPGGGGGEGHSGGFPGGQGVKGVRESGVESVGIVVWRGGGKVRGEGGGYALGKDEWVDRFNVTEGDGAFLGVVGGREWG